MHIWDKTAPNNTVYDYENYQKVLLNISVRVAEGYLATWESAQGALGVSLHTRVVELEEAAAFFEPWHLWVQYRFDKYLNVPTDQGGGVGRSWDLLRAWTSPTFLWSLLSNEPSVNANQNNNQRCFIKCFVKKSDYFCSWHARAFWRAAAAPAAASASSLDMLQVQNMTCCKTSVLFVYWTSPDMLDKKHVYQLQ